MKIDFLYFFIYPISVSLSVLFKSIVEAQHISGIFLLEKFRRNNRGRFEFTADRVGKVISAQ